MAAARNCTLRSPPFESEVRKIALAWASVSGASGFAGLGAAGCRPAAFGADVDGAEVFAATGGAVFAAAGLGAGVAASRAIAVKASAAQWWSMQNIVWRHAHRWTERSTKYPRPGARSRRGDGYAVPEYRRPRR